MPIPPNVIQTIRHGAATMSSAELTDLADLCTALAAVEAPEPLDPPQPWREHPRYLAALDEAVATWRASL